MSESVALLEGEVHPSQHRDCLSKKKTGPLVLRGAAVTLYCLREMSQGEHLYLDINEYLDGRSEDSKAYDHRFRRVGFQRKAPQNNFRRIIAAPIPEGHFCFESIKYATENSSKLDLDLLLGLLNSQILDWYFRTTSSNAQINEYQFNLLPVPTPRKCGQSPNWKSLLDRGDHVSLVGCLQSGMAEIGVLPDWVASAIAEMSRQIQLIESKRVLGSRSERSHLAPASQAIQDVIDAVLFRCYGLTDPEASYVRSRLREML
jgi:hypothetical protein